MNLRIVLILALAFALQACSSLSSSVKKPLEAPKPTTPKLSFDKKLIPNKPSIIEKMISVVQPELKEEKRKKIAQHMSNALKKHKVEPQVMVAIVDTESNFSSGKVSSTGDLSVAQINPEVWNKELVRMKREPLDMIKIKTDEEYALTKMAEILEILKKRYSSRDRRWYARYHSSTWKYKKEYIKRLELRMKMLAKTNLNEKKERQPSSS